MKVKCSKPCEDRKTCRHLKPHKKIMECLSGCDNGAKCVPVLSEIVPTFSDKPTTNTAEHLNAVRGAEYGHPLDDFTCASSMYATWLRRRRDAIAKGAQRLDGDKERSIRHAAMMCFVKLSRAAQSPNKLDHWDDLGGYAGTAKMILSIEI